MSIFEKFSKQLGSSSGSTDGIYPGANFELNNGESPPENPFVKPRTAPVTGNTPPAPTGVNPSSGAPGGAAAAPVKRLSIEQAVKIIEMFQSDDLPADQVAKIMRFTLESVNISYDDLVREALQKEQKMHALSDQIVAKIDDLEAQIDHYRAELETMRMQIDQARTIREFLQLGDDPPTTRTRTDTGHTQEGAENNAADTSHSVEEAFKYEIDHHDPAGKTPPPATGKKPVHMKNIAAENKIQKPNDRSKFFPEPDEE